MDQEKFKKFMFKALDQGLVHFDLIGFARRGEPCDGFPDGFIVVNHQLASCSTDNKVKGSFDLRD